MKKLFFIIFFVRFLFAQLDYGFDFSKSGSAGFQFLKINIGAGPTGMGGAGVSLVDDGNAIFWNVAGITGIDRLHFSVSDNDWLVNSKIQSAVLAKRFKDNVFAVNLISFRVESFEETTIQEPYGTGRMVNAGDDLFGLAYGRNFTDKLSLGIQLKYVNEILDDYSFSNVMVDVGSLYKTGIRNLALAFVFQHFGPDISPVNKKFRSPLLFKIGASDYLFKSNTSILTLGLDLVHPIDGEEFINAGLEGSVLNTLNLRIGNQYNRDLLNFSYGLGLNEIKMFGGIVFSMDYSFSTLNNIFSDIHRITFGIKF